MKQSQTEVQIDSGPSSIRVDKWLWAARFFKTRTLAQDNVELGRVRVEGQRVKPSKEIKVGDELEIYRGQEKFVVIVKALSTKRGPASVAQTMYQETTESQARRELIKENNRLVPMPGSDYKGRPSKRDGRKIREFKESFNPSHDI